ncbi:uncharacterized protein LOC105421750 isoform X1 [Amborella trichopoda]|uniref:uncharacterized protein LOC105421750 isoform X1 n=1 Tax=Amborella trichopoda TaxID=13333 RepID=UPI0009BE0F09|nr:uncharacterized protein LOC105421750 isoform X1 [Amborella trichopoda]|eukprot:XP_020531994.1 uncharacterized protein LOC105421750 isoform X1 [Amborella trichopoda]
MATFHQENELQGWKKQGEGLQCLHLPPFSLCINLLSDRSKIQERRGFTRSSVCWSQVAYLFSSCCCHSMRQPLLQATGSVSFLVGFFLIFIGWPIVGVILESYGSIVLFSGFWPACKAFLCHIPILGWLFQYSFLFFDRFKLKSGS